METEELRLRRDVAVLLRRALDFEIDTLGRDDLPDGGFSPVLGPLRHVRDQLLGMRPDVLMTAPIEDVELVREVVSQLLDTFDGVLAKTPRQSAGADARAAIIERVGWMQLDVSSMLRVLEDHRQRPADDEERELGDDLDRSLAEQIEIDEHEVERRMALVGLVASDRDLLESAKPLVVDAIDAVVTSFLSELKRGEGVTEIIGDRESLARFADALRGYIVDLFGGRYDAAYVDGRLRLGLVKKRVGVEPKHYLAACKILKDTIGDAVGPRIEDPEERFALLDALDRLLLFDVQLVIEAYIRSVRTEVESSRDQVMRYAVELERRVAERTKQLRRQSRTDALTGLSNVCAFREDMRLELARARRTQLPVSFVCLELDGFDTIRQQLGAAGGEDVLRRFGSLIAKLTREVDHACRVDGSEFGLLLPNTPKDGASVLLKRLRNHVVASLNVNLSAAIIETGPDEFGDGDELFEEGRHQLRQVRRSKRAVDAHLRDHAGQGEAGEQSGA